MMFGYGLNSTPAMTPLGLHQYPRPSSQLNYPTHPVPSATANDYSPRPSLVFPSATPIRLGTGVVRPVSWATAFPEPYAPRHAVVDGSAALGCSAMQSALQQSSAEHCGDDRSLIYGVATPATDVTGLQSNGIVYGGMTKTSYDSGNWSWKTSGVDYTSDKWDAFDSKHDNKPQLQTTASNDFMTSSTVDSIDIDFTQPRDDEKAHQSVAAIEDGSDPYVARVRVVDDGDRSLSAGRTINAVTDLTLQGREEINIQQQTPAMSDEMEYGKATVFVNEIIDCGSQQPSLVKTNITTISRDRVTSSSSRDNDIPLCTVIARTDGHLAEQSSRSHFTAPSMAGAVTSSSRQTQPANNSVGNVINTAVMRPPASAESERNRAAPEHSSSANLVSTEFRNIVGNSQSSAERAERQLVQLESSFEYSTRRQVSDYQPTEQVTKSSVVRPPLQPSGNGIGGWRSRTIDDDFNGQDEQFETHLPTRKSDLSNDLTPHLPLTDRKQLATGGAHASRSQSAFASSAFPDLDRQLQQLQLERQPADSAKVPFDRQVLGGPRAVTSFLRVDQIRMKADNGDKELIGDAFKFLDEFDE